MGWNHHLVKVNGICPPPLYLVSRNSEPSTVVWLCGCIDYTLNLHWLLVMAFQAAEPPMRGPEISAENPVRKPGIRWKKLVEWNNDPVSWNYPETPGCWLDVTTRLTFSTFLGSGNPKPTNKPSFVTWLAGILVPTRGVDRPNPKITAVFRSPSMDFDGPRGNFPKTNFRKLNVWDPHLGSQFFPRFSFFEIFQKGGEFLSLNHLKEK